MSFSTSLNLLAMIGFGFAVATIALSVIL